MSSMSKSYESVHTAFSAYQRAVSSDPFDDVRRKLQFRLKCHELNHSFSCLCHYSHNTHHYLEFFKAIRQHIKNDTLPVLLTLIREQQAKYDAEQQLAKEQQDEISKISADANSSPVKRLKNVANETE